MHITLLHHSAPPVVGGVESVLAHHARLFIQAGHTVRMLAGRGAAGEARIEFWPEPLVDSQHPLLMELKTALNAGEVPPEFAARVDEVIRALTPPLADTDCLIAHNVCSLNKNLALTAALHQLHSVGRITRLILWHHDLAWTTPRYRAELHEGYPWDLLRTPWPGARQVVVSEARQHELAELMRLPLEQIAVVPNGIETAYLYKLEPQTQPLARAMGLEHAQPLLLLPVRLTPRKNIELALRSLAALRHLSPQAMLLVTGPQGPHNPANAEYKTRLLTLRDELGLQGAAHFAVEHTTDFLPDAVIADFYRLADALLLPSREEGFGIPLLEAAFTRLPVFCADIPPLRALGGDDVSYFSPDADPHVVAALIHSRLAANSVYQFAARARHHFAWETIYTQHIAPLLRL